MFISLGHPPASILRDRTTVYGRKLEISQSFEDVKATCLKYMYTYTQYYCSNLQIAALCHDLGHGPFSHMFDKGVVKVIEPGIHWKHERFSKLIISKAILKKGSSTWRSFYEDWGLTDQDLNFILKLVDADEESTEVRKKHSLLLLNTTVYVDFRKACIYIYIPCTLYPIPYTLYPKPYTLYSILYRYTLL